MRYRTHNMRNPPRIGPGSCTIQLAHQRHAQHDYIGHYIKVCRRHHNLLHRQVNRRTVVTEKLNKANELYLWCPNNLLTPHPSKCGAVIMPRGVFQGSINSFTIGTNKEKWVSKTHLLGVNLDNKLDWSKHVLEVRKSFAALPTKTCSNGFISLGQLP